MGVGALGIGHVAVQCSDLERSLHFYLDTLGLCRNATLGPRKGSNTKIDVGGGTFIELFPPKPGMATGSGSLMHFSITVASVDEALRELRNAGVEVLSGPFTVNADDPTLPTRRAAFVAGPDGEEIELVENC